MGTPENASNPDIPVPVSAPDTAAPRAGFAHFWAQFMFYFAGLYLACLGFVLPHTGQPSEGLFALIKELPWVWPNLFLVMWGIIVVEGFFGLVLARDRPFHARILRWIFISLIPGMRMVFSVSRPNRLVWVPRRGWLNVSEESSRKLEVTLAIPMLIITLLILPVLGLEYGFHDLVKQNPNVGIALHVLTALIWFAFAVEFILLFGVAEKKLAFCKRHIINIVIIILPMVAFLRVLRIFRAGRVMRLWNMLKIGKMLRVYRLRGIQMRFLRVIMLFKLIDRFLHNRQPERYQKIVETQIADKEKELAELRAKLEEIQAEVARRKREQTKEE